MYEPKLQDNEYKDDTASDKPIFGDEYNMSLFKELMKTRKEDKEESQEGKMIEPGQDDTTEPLFKREDKNPEGVQAGSITRHSK